MISMFLLSKSIRFGFRMVGIVTNTARRELTGKIQKLLNINSNKKSTWKCKPEIHVRGVKLFLDFSYIQIEIPNAIIPNETIQEQPK